MDVEVVSWSDRPPQRNAQKERAVTEHEAAHIGGRSLTLVAGYDGNVWAYLRRLRAEREQLKAAA